jgi:NADH-quinone oxidoreductase subunit M|nr:MAG: oxidoreductase [Bacteroidota bacterium]
MAIPWLSLLLALPLVGSLLVLWLPEGRLRLIRCFALGVMLLELLLAAGMMGQYDPGRAGVNEPEAFQFVERTRLFTLPLGAFGRFAVDYYVGIDGLSLTLLLLTVLIGLIGVLSSWTIERAPRAYFSLYLLLIGAIVGVFVALDLFLFYVFWELMLLPMYFLIGFWGGERREYAAVKFFLYTLAGSIFLLLVLIGLYLGTALDPGAPPPDRVRVLDLLWLMRPEAYVPGSLLDPSSPGLIGGHNARLIAFAVLFLGFAIKLPVVPLHTWLPDAHVEAPTPISVILAGVLLKLGGYGIVRLGYGLFPEGGLVFGTWIALLGMIGVVYGAFVAAAQEDLKKLIAYSSVSHMGYVLLGLASLTQEGVAGALFQMFNHGLIAAMLFLLVGVLYDRVHDRLIPHFQGLSAIMPLYGGVALFAFLASLGLPGLAGFVSEALIFLGAFSAEAVHPGHVLVPRWMVLVSTAGLVLAAVYYLWAVVERMFHGPLRLQRQEWQAALVDLSWRERIMFLPLMVLILGLGLYPQAYLELVRSSTNHFLEWVLTSGKAWWPGGIASGLGN